MAHVSPWVLRPAGHASTPPGGFVRRLTSIATGLALAAGSLALASPASAAVATKVSVKVDHAPAYVGDEVTANGKLTRSNGRALRGKNLLLTYGGGKKIVTT